MTDIDILFAINCATGACGLAVAAIAFGFSRSRRRWRTRALQAERAFNEECLEHEHTRDRLERQVGKLFREKMTLLGKLGNVSPKRKSDLKPKLEVRA